MPSLGFLVICFFGLILFPIMGFVFGKINFSYLSFGLMCFFWPGMSCRNWQDNKKNKNEDESMGAPIVKLDLHGLYQEEAMKVIDKAIAAADASTYQIQLIHGYNRGTNLRTMIYDWYKYDKKVKRIMPGDNPGITVLVMRELY